MNSSRQSGRIVVEAFRGYGSVKEVRLAGRVHKRPVERPRRHRHAFGRALSAVVARFLRGGVPQAVLEARAAGAAQRVVADRSGYFSVHLELAAPPETDDCWTQVEVELVEPKGAADLSKGEVFVAPKTAEYVVVSDIDDTIMETGVANKLIMLWRLFAQRAESRTAFPGVADLLTALHRGKSGQATNPMLYVSRAPWSLYPVLDEFFDHHRIPIGPVLYLRDWGMHRRHLLPKRSKGHKLERIEEMLAVYRGLPFILIGDSGQRDPEIYTEIVRRHPKRVLAVYIRDVVRRPSRSQAIEKLAQQVAAAGSSLILAEDSEAIARHAAAQGFIRRSEGEKTIRSAVAEAAVDGAPPDC